MFGLYCFACKNSAKSLHVQVYIGKNKRKCKFFVKKCKKIWWNEKKIVILHEFSRIVGRSMWMREARMSGFVGLTN
jgi:hypothetical protein